MSFTRICRHCGCTCRRPGHWRFHAAGILREIRPLFHPVMLLSYGIALLAGLGWGRIIAWITP